MDVYDYKELWPIILLGVAFFVVAVTMLYWSAKKGHLRNFDSQAKTIFTEEEPEGEVSDAFPDSRKHSRSKDRK
ncbi:hypothetical protein DDZ13_03445 [Coraliomargarita sinensis]|uniref:CcoQ/FixQ family Cbb3-type cytochrome c oxidase assembly chaperone n=1 Tax=Coraliomargarita sinensis TaxID=2174842 RepID=A0A317ZNW4_9BACT|nr:hypothetical protein [Coraliomargarita sinensis]PXA05031.1 hypothetical protein DDZ13_03445 [Coraliomargarita sinensis]